MSMTSVGQIGLDLKVNNNNLSQQINKSVNGSLKNVNKTVSGSLTSGFKKLGKAVVAAFAVQKVIQFGKACVQLGSDLAEVQNVVDVAFGDMKGKMEEFAKTSIKTYGISALTAKQTGSSYMAMARGMGMASDVASDMALKLTGLSADMASFYNISQSEARTALSAVFTGETETLKRYGILITEVNLQEYARQRGITKSIAKMTQQEKVMLRYNYILQSTALAQGDFARTQGTWANQTRMLSQNFDALKTTLGQLLINVLLPLVKMLNSVVEATNRAATALADFFGVSNQASGGAGAAVIAGATGEASENLDEANASAKALKKSLAGFDKLNVLGSDSSDGAGGSTPDLGGLSTTGGNSPAEEVKKANPLLDQLKAKVKAIFDVFKGGFKIGFNGTSLKNFKSHLSGIKNSVVGIFSDKAVQSSASGFLDNLAKNIGKSVGAISSIGVTVGEFLTGSIEKYLDQHGGSVKQHIINMFDITGQIQDIVGNFRVAVAELFEVFRSDDAKQIGADLLTIFTEPFMTAIETCGKFTRDFAQTFTQPIIDNLDEIKLAFSKTFGSLKIYTGALSRTVTNISKTIRETYDEYIAPAFKNIREGFSKIVKAVVNAYNTHLAPVIDKLSRKFGDMWENHIGPALQKVIVFVGKVADCISTIWKNVLAPVVSWIIQKVAPKVSAAIEYIGSIFSTVFSAIGDIVNGLFTTLGGLLDFITGVFSGDWKKAWGGIKDVFKGIWDSLVGIAKAPINLIIDALNALIRGMNKISIDVPEWVQDITGTKADKWGFNISEIPHLANGGFVKANTPQLAVIGDNRHEGEIVAPESKITEAVAAAIGPLISEVKALIAAVNRGGNGSNGQTIKLIVDGKQLFEWFVKYNNSLVKQTGKSPLKT